MIVLVLCLIAYALLNGWFEAAWLSEKSRSEDEQEYIESRGMDR